MNKGLIKFILIKFLIFFIFTIIAFLAFVLIDALLGTMISDQLTETAVSSAISYVVFLGFSFGMIRKINDLETPASKLIIKECLVYMAYILIPTTMFLVMGKDSVYTNRIMQFFAPHIPFHLLINGVVGFVLNSLIFSVAAVIARKTKKVKLPEEEITSD